MTAIRPEDPAPQDTVARSEAPTPHPVEPPAPTRPYEANARLIRSRLADGQRPKPRRWWRFLP